MAKIPHIQFYPGDWLRDGVSGCSLAAQGLWLRMMFVAHDAENYGHIFARDLLDEKEATARRCGCSFEEFEKLFNELMKAKVPSIEGGIVISRRMVRDAKIRKVRACAGKKGGQQTAKQKRSKRTANMAAKPQQNPDNDNDNDNQSKLKKEVSPIESIEPPELRESVNVWIEYKREKGDRYKPAGLKALVKKIQALASEHGPAAVVSDIESAMAVGYAGFGYEIKTRGRASPAADDPRGNKAAARTFLERHAKKP